MPSYAHKKIAERLLAVDQLPADDVSFEKWISADAHLQLLSDNVFADEFLFYGSGPYSFVHSLIMPDAKLLEASEDELLQWSCNPFNSIASYVSGGGCQDMWIERHGRSRGSEVLDSGSDLVFGRTFEGWSGRGRDYFEVNQEYTHLTNIHWRSEEGAYCKFDGNGDLRRVISITCRDSGGGLSLVTFTWQELEEYLAIGNASILRMFDFTLLRRDTFADWPKIDEEMVRKSNDLFYRQKIGKECAYTRGVQVVRPRRSSHDVSSAIRGQWTGREDRQHATFLVNDWRHKCLARVSTDPAATSNYFDAEGNNLPFELSPAFFRPEVLSKYKTDRENYTIAERSITCRSAWYLKGYDVNDAGQVPAYLCDLRSLPYSEQLHWLSFNEEPSAGISARAYTNDFKGEFVNFAHPREDLISIVRRWSERPVEWWKLRSAELLDGANTPLTTSKNEWAEAVTDLSKLIVEGFEVKALRRRLSALSTPFHENDKTITLLEILLNRSRHPDQQRSLGLREVQRIRSKVAAHASGSEGRQIAADAIRQHGSYKDHFTSLCSIVAAELETIALGFETPV